MSIFGTDGVRDRAGEGFLAPESVAKISRALASVLQDREEFAPDIGAERGQAVYIGRDTRASGPELFERYGMTADAVVAAAKDSLTQV